MVTVDDATYVKMRDNLYGGNEAQASKAKAKIESSYTDEQYNKFVSGLGQVPTQQATPVNQPTATPKQTSTATPVKEETVVKQEETVGSTVPEIKQEGALKPQTQEYYNQESSDAQDKIVANLNQYKQTNPEYFTDYESFKKNFSYNARNDIQKQTLDTWYKGYEQSLQLSSTPVNDLYTQYKNGQISASELEGLRVSNPEKYAELQTQINKGNIIAAYDDDTAPTTMNFQEMAYQMMAQALNKMSSGDYGTSGIFQEYEEKMNSPEMLELSDQTTEIEENIKNIQDDIDRMKEEVEREFEGTGATRSKINAIIADRTYDLQLQLRTLNNEYTKYATQYNNRANQYQNEFQLQLQEYQLNMQARNQQMSELGFAMDLMNFETNEQKAQREWDYWVKQQEYTNGNINSSDYQTRYKAALSSVQNLLSQYEGIPMQRSAEQMAEDILKNMEANGTTLGEELSTINKQIQGKKEYKILYNNTYGNKNVSTASSDLKTYKIGDKEYVLYNDQLMSADEFNSKYGGLTENGTAITYGGIEYTPINSYTLQGDLQDFANNHAVGTTGGWCGKFVNDYLQSIGLGRLYGDSISSKTNTINTDKNDLSNLSVGSVAVFDYSNSKGVGENARNYGHVAIVTDIDTANGRVKLLESNYNGDKKVTNSRRVDVGRSGALKGFFDPSKGSVSISESTTTETPKNQTALDRLTLQAYQNGQINKSETLKTLEQLVNAGFSEEEISNAINRNMASYLPDEQRDAYEYAYNKFSSNDIVKNFQSSTEQLLGLSAAVDQENGAGDLASIYMFMRAQDPKSVVREGEFEMAAQTMGLGGQVETWFTKLANGQRLTPEQRQNFIDVTVKVLEAKKQAYKLVYDEAIQQMKAANIPSVYYPTDWATEIDGIISKLKGGTTNTSNTGQSTKISSVGWTPSWYSTLPQTSTGVNNNYTNVGGFNVPTNFYQK